MRRNPTKNKPIDANLILIHSFIFVFFYSFLGLFLRLLSPVAFAGELSTTGDSSAGGDPSAGGSGSAGWLGLILALSFALLVELIQLKKTTRTEDSLLDNPAKDHTHYDLNLDVLKTRVYTLKSWKYGSGEERMLLDWLATHWTTIQHSLALVGGALIYFYFTKKVRALPGKGTPTKPSSPRAKEENKGPEPSPSPKRTPSPRAKEENKGPEPSPSPKRTPSPRAKEKEEVIENRKASEEKFLENIPYTSPKEVFASPLTPAVTLGIGLGGGLTVYQVANLIACSLSRKDTEVMKEILSEKTERVTGAPHFFHFGPHELEPWKLPENLRVIKLTNPDPTLQQVFKDKEQSSTSTRGTGELPEVLMDSLEISNLARYKALQRHNHFVFCSLYAETVLQKALDVPLSGLAGNKTFKELHKVGAKNFVLNYLFIKTGHPFGSYQDKVTKTYTKTELKGFCKLLKNQMDLPEVLAILDNYLAKDRGQYHNPIFMGQLATFDQNILDGIKLLGLCNYQDNPVKILFTPYAALIQEIYNPVYLEIMIKTIQSDVKNIFEKKEKLVKKQGTKKRR